MANRCLVCDKKKHIGISSRHHRGVAGKQWMKRAPKTKRTFSPNLQWARVDGIRIKVCAKCLKLIKKEQPKSNLPETASK